MNAKLIILLIIGIWLGMLMGISFLEAPLKFRAPNITLTLGLGIGKLVFSALNKFEIFFSVLLTIWLVKEYRFLESPLVFSYGILVVSIVVQTVWLIPILNARADNLIAGIEVAKTNHHFYYVAMEVIKLISLFYAFIKTFNYGGHP